MNFNELFNAALPGRAQQQAAQQRADAGEYKSLNEIFGGGGWEGRFGAAGNGAGGGGLLDVNGAAINSGGGFNGAMSMGNLYGDGKEWFGQRQNNDSGPGYVMWTDDGRLNRSYDQHGNSLGSYKGNAMDWGETLALGAMTILGGMGMGGALSAGAAGGAGGMGAAGGGMSAAGDAFMPGAMGANGANIGAGLTGLEGYAAAGSMAGDAFMPGMMHGGGNVGGLGSLEGFATGGMAPGDAFMPGMMNGDAMMPGGLNIGGATPTGFADIPGLEQYLSGATPNSGSTAGRTASSSPSGMNPLVKQGVQSVGTNTLQKMLGGGGSNSGGVSASDLASIVAGLMDYRGNKNSSKDMLDFMNNSQKKIDDLYKPGSEEWNHLWEAMSRKDAAAGRNSQYGPRSVDFLGKVADTKARYTAELAKGFAGNAQEAFNQRGVGSTVGLNAALKGILSGNSPVNLSSVLDFIKTGGSNGALDLGGGLTMNPDGSIGGNTSYGGDLSNSDIDDMINGF